MQIMTRMTRCIRFLMSLKGGDLEGILLDIYVSSDPLQALSEEGFLAALQKLIGT